MKICGTSLIPIFVTIIFCGAIFVYFNMHLAEVKNSVEKQNRVLTAFITNVQNDIRSGGMIFGANVVGSNASGGGYNASDKHTVIGANHLASEEAIRSVKLAEKIVVSDDECDESDSDSESDDESNTSSDEDEQVTSEVKIINLHESFVLTEIDEETPTPTQNEVEVVSLSDIVSLELISDNLTLELDQLPELNFKVVDLNTSFDSTKTEVNYEQMKVDDLRKIAMDLNLGGKDEIKKLKKPELLVLLKNKPS